MLEPRRIESYILPKAFENLGNGNWYYNYDIKPEVIPSLEDDDTSVTIYSYIQIKTVGKPDYKKCVETLIRKYITQGKEFDLINSTNKALLRGAEQDIPSEYLEYLDLLDEIKTKVRADFGM